MSEQNPAGRAMGDIIGATRQRLEEPMSAADRLKSLVAATSPTPAPVPPLPPREAAPTVLPTNYFPQIGAENTILPKRKPQRGPARSLHISMRLSPPERDRLVTWCDARNLSLPDGIMALLDLADRAGEGA